MQVVEVARMQVVVSELMVSMRPAAAAELAAAFGAEAIMARVGSKPGKISLDGGKTWNPFPSQEPGGGGQIAISANGKTMVWMSDHGCFSSNDNGATWRPVPTLPQGSQITSDRVNPSKFYGFASKEGKFYTSGNGGASFELSEARLPGTHGYLRSAMRPVPGFEGHIYLTTQNWKQASCLYKSADSGRSFVPISGMNQNEQPVTGNTTVRSVRAFGFGKPMPGRRYPALYLSGRINPPSGVNKEALYRSDDGGTSWIRINDDKNNFPGDVLVGDSRIPGRVYVGTLDGRLVALNADTGKVMWDKMTIPQGSNMAITGAPRIVKGKVLIGSAGAEYITRGYLAAYDAESGEEAWRFYTVPGDPSKPFEGKHLEAAAKTWAPDAWKSGGGGTVWDSITYDPATNLVFFGTGNAEPWPQALRTKGASTGQDNLYVASIVAVNVNNGELKWHYQVVPGDDLISNQRWAGVRISDLLDEAGVERDRMLFVGHGSNTVGKEGGAGGASGERLVG